MGMRKRHWQVQHDQNRLIIIRGRISWSIVVLVLLVLMLGVSVPSVQILDRPGMNMGLMPIVVVDEDCLSSDRAHKKHGDKGA